MGATKLVFCQLSAASRARLGVSYEATTTLALLAAYRRVRYLFHRILSVVDPSGEPKNRRLSPERYEELRADIGDEERARRQAALEELVADLVAASVGVATNEELAGVSGSVGLDATPVPLFSRGPSQRTGLSAADPDGGWYVREGDHREHTGPSGKPVRKVAWALEATIATLGRGPDTDPAHEALAAPGRRRVRGIAAQSLFVAFLVMAANVRKIAAHRQLVADGGQRRVAERARRRRVSLTDFRPPP